MVYIGRLQFVLGRLQFRTRDRVDDHLNYLPLFIPNATISRLTSIRHQYSERPPLATAAPTAPYKQLFHNVNGFER